MNIRQLQYEIRAIELMAKYQPIIDEIMTRTDGIKPMSAKDRRAWIERRTLHTWNDKTGEALIFIEDWVNGTIKFGDSACGLENSDLGKELLKKYSANDIIYACTYWSLINLFQASKGETSTTILIDGNPPILHEALKKKEERRGNLVRTIGINLSQWSQDQLFITELESRGARVQIVGNVEVFEKEIETFKPQGEIKTASKPLIYSSDEINKAVKAPSADFVVDVDKDFFQNVKIMFAVGYKSDPSQGSSVAQTLFVNKMSSTDGSMYFSDYDEGFEIVENPIVFQLDGENVVAPASIGKWIRESNLNSFRLFRKEGGWIADGSTKEMTQVEVPRNYDDPSQGMVTIDVPVIQILNVFVWDEFETYVGLGVKYDPTQPMKQPLSRQEIQASQVDVLTLPAKVLMAQSREMYNGRKLPISAISLDKWKNSGTSYEDAVRIMTEHLAFYTTSDEAGNRTNNGQIYEQTKNGVAKRLTDSKGKLDQLAFMEVMSKYAYTIEETFFNLNPDFSNPEKLLGYFLGMGIVPNNLFINEVSPYRMLCARLLGIDYGVNYLELCKQSTARGYLFIKEFVENQPVFCNAEALLDRNVYSALFIVESDEFQASVKDYFGKDVGAEVLQFHLELLKEHSPKFMKFRHGTKQEYQSAVRANGADKPYPEDREQEITRITMANGLFPTSSQTEYITEIALIMREEDNPYLAADKIERKLYNDGYVRYESLYDPMRMMSRYSSQSGVQVASRASDKIRYNNITKQNAIDQFFNSPQGTNAGVMYLLDKGITLSNKELGENKDERKTAVIRFDWRGIKARKKVKGETKIVSKYNSPPKAGVDFMLEFLGLDDKTQKIPEDERLPNPFREDTEDVLRELGYGYLLQDKKKLRRLLNIIYQRARGLYHEIQSQARIEGDNLYSLSLALGENEPTLKTIEAMWNAKYNNFGMKPMSRVPIFMENRRHFGDIGRFVADRFNEDGSAAGFNLREAQKDGLKFLAANGNSGLLAHEVGFGKTTSSIAKVSDMFLRGDAKRVLISVPNPVYTTGNWEREIEGKNTDGRRVSNGLLPSSITLVKIGSLNKSDLQGRKIDKSDPNWEEKSEGTGYDGPIAYTEAELKLMEDLKGTTETLTSIVGGAFQKYGGQGAPLTPREQKFGLEDADMMWLQANPFFKESKPVEKSQIVRLNNLPKQSLAGLTTSIQAGDFDFWDIGDSQYMEFGKIEDVDDDSIKAEDSFLKKMAQDLVAKSPEIQIDGTGGELKSIINKLVRIHDKYQKRYADMIRWADDRKNGLKKTGNTYDQNVLGGAFKPNSGAVTKSMNKDYKDMSGVFAASKFSRDTSSWYIAFRLWEYLNGASSSAWYPFIGTRSFFERVVIPWAEKNHKKSSIDTLWEALKSEFPVLDVNVDQRTPDARMKSLAQAQIKTALELQMTEEIAFFFETLTSQAPLFFGTFKEWANRPNSIVLCSHLAIPKLSVSEKLGKESVLFMSGIYDDSSPEQLLNVREPNPYVKKERVIRTYPSKSEKFEKGVLTRGQRSKLFLSQYRGMELSRLNCDAFVVDEVHNFNRAFNMVRKGSMVAQELQGRQGKYGRNTEENIPQGGMVNANVKGTIRYPEKVFEFDTSANYNIRGEVQNFIAVCLYFQERARLISEPTTRKIDNTIFLSATPFTDDNFQMLSLFGALSMKRLMQGNIFNTFDFFQLYAKELWQKDIDYQNRYTLFPKIVGYKNIYSLSQMIRTFTNFKISDAEIEAKRPAKILVGVKPPNIDGAQDDALSKLVSQVPFNEVQKKMNEDLTKYITLQSDSELQYSDADLKKAVKIFKKLEKEGGKKGNPADPLVKELRALAFDKEKVSVDVSDEEKAVKLSDDILEIDAENKWAKLFLAWYDNALEEGAESDEGGAEQAEEETDDSDNSTIDANAVSNESNTASLAQKIAQRALEASRTQQLTLVSPYYLTINNDKELFNPYLPTLDGTESENAKNVVENSPKLLYACQAVAKVIKHAIEEKGQTYMGADRQDPIMGQVVYANNYKFRYHGKDFFLFDLMKKYIQDENKELLLPLVGNDENRLDELFASIDGRTKKIKDPDSGEMIDEKAYLTQKFQTGQILVLFGTEIIREGINLQKNCPLMYILQVGFVPVTYMQLHGRVWRQGNPYKYAFLINVLTQNSIDAFVYSKLDQKIDSVKQMLGSDVYDSEATQFDVDVKEIKTELISDPEKLAEMQWEDDQSDLSRLTDKLREELELLPSLSVDYPLAVAKYGEAINQLNNFAKKFYEIDSLIVGSHYQRFKNQKMRNDAALKQADVDFPNQFPSDKVKEDFVKDPDNKKFLDKDGNAKYETKQEMISRLRSEVKITELSLPKAVEAVQKAAKAKETLDGNVAFRLSLAQPFAMTTLTSTSAFAKNVEIVKDLAQKAELALDSAQREGADKISELTDPALKVKEAISKSVPTAKKPDKLFEALGMLKNQGSYGTKGRNVVVMATLRDANEGWADGVRVYPRQLDDLAKSFRVGDEAITIGAFNDIVSTEQMGDGDDKRDATLKDIPAIIERKQKALDDAQYQLDNEDEAKEELRKYFAKKIAERDGQKVPSVEERVNDLEAIFPYLIRR
jgi:superfamily II DNA or RNA helicase